jgi:hypothetical protein
MIENIINKEEVDMGGKDFITLRSDERLEVLKKYVQEEKDYRFTDMITTSIYYHEKFTPFLLASLNKVQMKEFLGEFLKERKEIEDRIELTLHGDLYDENSELFQKVFKQRDTWLVQKPTEYLMKLNNEELTDIIIRQETYNILQKEYIKDLEERLESFTNFGDQFKKQVSALKVKMPQCMHYHL